MNFNLTLTQEQKLIMTQQMQLSIKLLQMSSYELERYVEKQLQENPVLDAQNNTKDNKSKDDVDYKDLVKSLYEEKYNNVSFGKVHQGDEEEVSPFNFISEEKSLKEFLKEQIREIRQDEYMKAVCFYIVENINEKGYLQVDEKDIAKEIKISLEKAKKAIEIIQSLEPDGIGARNLKECLKIQLNKKNIKDNNIFIIIDNHLNLIAENKYNVIAKKLNVSIQKAQEYGDLIKTLQPKPSRGFYTGEEVKYIVPDAYIKKIDDKYYIMMNDELCPKLNINTMYKDIILNNNDKDAVDYIKEKLNSAIFLIKSIESRKSTIYRVLEKIIDIQKNYFDYGIDYLKPMTLKEIADSLQMHESTVSRAIRDKYIHTSNGTLLIKDLFTTGITSKNSYGEEVSVERIKKKIRSIIDEEDKKKPISDQKICDLLNEAGLKISRRTVAKYREEMEIPSSKCRKRF